MGVLAIRNLNHICMLFVDKNYHKHGVAKKINDYRHTILYL
ncbi:GNAT family N-acetyltransferase [Clostridioides difficile]